MALLTEPQCRLLATLATLGLFAGLAGAASDPDQMEYEVKAAFLYNFAKFVQWPAETGGSNQPMRLCIYGRDPFGGALDAALNGKTVGEKPIEIARPSDTRQLAGCQMVFISSSAHSQVEGILEALSSRPVLTVSEIPGFAACGGMVNFYMEDRRIRFEINPNAATSSGLRVSSQLLKLSRIVDLNSTRRAK